jgi:hypothetical protein
VQPFSAGAILRQHLFPRASRTESIASATRSRICYHGILLPDLIPRARRPRAPAAAPTVTALASRNDR